MVFSSLLFIFVFLPLNLIFYYSFKNRKVKNFILVVFSLIFYAWGEPIWISLLILSSLIDYLNGLFIEKYRGRTIAKLGIYSTIIFNIGLLMTFKYSDFIVENVNYLCSSHFNKPGFLLPIGISFYTFQTISYTIDVYRGVIKAQRSFLNFLMFVSLYHQLVAGPIVRYSHIAREIEERIFSWDDFSSGVTRFCIGLFKKVCIANIAGGICGQFLDGESSSLTVIGGWYGLILYGIQIYFDFSGYSDMAIGLGRMFGFHFFENFNYPYISTSITDFWRRWHISLSTWLTDYIFMPLTIRYRNYGTWSLFFGIMITFFISGFWHGAGWNFIMWGLYFGSFVFLEKVVINRILKNTPKAFKHLYFLFTIIVSWSFFYFTDFNKLRAFLRLIFNLSGNDFINLEVRNSLLENIFWLLFALLLCLPVYQWVQSKMELLIRKKAIITLLNILLNFIFFMTSVFLLVGSTYNPFLYFRF